MNRQSQDGIEILEEILRITEDYILNKNRTTEIALEDMLIALAPVVYNETI